jgi:hypothetical protein
VVDAERLFNDTPLTEGIEKHVPESFTKGVEPIFRASFSDEPETPVAAVKEEYYRQDENDDKCYYGC